MEQLIQLAPLLLVFPGIGVLFNGLVGRKFIENNRTTGEKWTGWFGTAMAVAAFFVAVGLFVALQAEPEEHIVYLFDWFDLPGVGENGFRVPWAMQIDTLSVTMMLVVTGVGSLIHMYAVGYMHGDEDFSRFFAYLNLFLFFMLILVSGSSYLVLFVGWEGVGLCSFLLIGFWWSKREQGAEGKPVGVLNSNAARKAFITNRVGDFFMVLAIILTFWAFGSVEFIPVFDHAIEIFEHSEEIMLFGNTYSIGAVLTVITLLFLGGAAGKSAQIPLYIWLPDAMAGPTPVSALIHAATMVTSGIYLIVRSNVLFEIARASGTTVLGGLTSNDIVALTGTTTALIAGLIAFTQFDIKKVLAYSTVSQLGFMIAAVGMGAYVAAMFHLVTHAFFKALLFLSAGSVIHGVEHGHHHVHEHGHHDQDHVGDSHAEFDPQDMRNMGGLRKMMPVTFWVYMIGTFALAGFFPFAGFWSKDEILAHANNNPGWVYTVVYYGLVLAAFCTAFYMGRQIKMVFFGKPRSDSAEHAVESSPTMTRPLVVLAFLTIIAGLLNLAHFTQTSYENAKAIENEIQLRLEHWLEHSVEAYHLAEEGIINLPKTPTVLQLDVALISTLLALAAIFLAAFVVYRNKPEKATDPDPLERTPIWWMAVLPINTIAMKGIVPAYNWLAYQAAYTLDWRFWHDWFHDRVIRDGFVAFANWLGRTFDLKAIDGGLVHGTARLVRGTANMFGQIQSGYVRNYALAVFLGVVAILTYFIFAYFN